MQYKIYEIDDSRDNADLMVNETVFHNANGYIGIRSNYEEGYPAGYDTIRGSYINGFYDIADMKQAERLFGLVEDKQAMLNVADTQTIYVTIDGEKFGIDAGTIISSRRWLDMEAGITGRKVHWRSPSGKEVEITVKRMTSFQELSLFTIEYGVKALNFDGSIRFESGHLGNVTNYSNINDPRVAQDSKRYLQPAAAQLEEGISYLVSGTSKSGLKVCTGVAHRLTVTGAEEQEIQFRATQKVSLGGAEQKDALSKIELNAILSGTENSKQLSGEFYVTLSKEEHNASFTAEIPVRMLETVTLTKYTIFCDSIRHRDCLAAAKQKMRTVLAVSLSEYYDAQREYLREFWDNCLLEITGDDALTEAVNYNMYQLIQSVGKDEYCNIAAKGLSGEGYEGHYFWDTEMYIEPFFNLTEPAITKNLISFRYSTMEQARENAGILGHRKGILYPWRTIMGVECSGYFPSGTAAYHINGDIAYSIIAYYLTTKDLDFIAEKGAEILFETARLWLDVGNYYKGSFRINEVTGPDEYTCMVNNNYYTNAAAQYNLSWAVKFYTMLKEAGRIEKVAGKLALTEAEVEEFRQAAEKMYLPYDEALGINPQDDSFLQKKVWDIPGTPAEHFPLLLHYHPLHLYRHQVCKQADTVLAHYIFEDAQSLETIRRSFDYYEKVTTHDSSLSTCIFSIVAAKLGLVDKAYDYFGDSAKLDLFNTHRNTKDGIHTANMGGTFMAIVYGFAGLRIKESGIYFAPVLPKNWEAYRFQINYEDSQIRVEVKKKETVFTLLRGTAKVLHIRDCEYRLNDKLIINNL